MVTPSTTSLSDPRTFGPIEGLTVLVGTDSAVMLIDLAKGLCAAVWDRAIIWAAALGWEPEDDVPDATAGQHDIYLMRRITPFLA